MLDFIKLCHFHHIPILEGSGHHHTHSGWVQTHCPFCAGGRGGYHLGYSTEKGNFNCWRCGTLRFWDVMAALLKLSDKQRINQIVSEFQSTRTPTVKAPVARRRRIKPPPGTEPLSPAHAAYLARRGFDPAALAGEWGLMGCNHLGGLWAWRVIIPICNGIDEVVAYQGRAIKDIVKPKYKMSDDKDCLEDPRSLLYGINKAEGDTVVVVEGATGVWNIGPGTLATLSIDWTREQANKLRRYKNRFILYDPEPRAQLRAKSLAEHLSLFSGNTEIVTGFACDPGELRARQVKKLRQRLAMQTLHRV